MTDVMICIHCGTPGQIDERIPTSPGVILYKPCVSCGKVGICREGDKYREIHKKKSFRESYEKSRYRGGKLPA